MDIFKIIKDAQRWRTLLESERIRIHSTVGLGSKEYQYFGVDFFSTFKQDREVSNETEYGQKVLTEYVDTIIEG